MNQFDKRSIAISFNNAAQSYDQHAVLQKTVRARLLERLNLVTITPRWIVDAGSGTGVSSRELAQRYRSAQIVQTDLAPAMLQTSRKRSWKLFSKHHYLCADVEMLPINAKTIDLVFSSLTYQWCENLDRLFTEAARVLRNNGMLLFATLGPDTLKELRDSWRQVDDKVHVSVFYDMHDIGDALIRAGLQGVVMDAETITMQYPDCRSLMRDIKAVGAHNASNARIRGLTGRKKIQLIEGAYEKFRVNGRLPATYEIVYGHAWAPAQDGGKMQSGVSYVPVEQIRRKP